MENFTETVNGVTIHSSFDKNKAKYTYNCEVSEGMLGYSFASFELKFEKITRDKNFMDLIGLPLKVLDYRDLCEKYHGLHVKNFEFTEGVKDIRSVLFAFYKHFAWSNKHYGRVLEYKFDLDNVSLLEAIVEIYGLPLSINGTTDNIKKRLDQFMEDPVLTTFLFKYNWEYYDKNKDKVKFS